MSIGHTFHAFVNAATDILAPFLSVYAGASPDGQTMYIKRPSAQH